MRTWGTLRTMIRAPRANVSFTTFVYASPVQTIPWCDHTGTLHFHSSVISGSAARMSARMRARVSPRHPPRSRMRWSMSREAGSVPACGEDWVSDWRGLLARDVLFAILPPEVDILRHCRMRQNARPGPPGGHR